MKELEIHYPFKPFIITQHWGNKNGMYKENGFDFDLHNGVDANVGQGKETYPVYCPVEGFVVHQVRYFPNGGGNEVWLMSKEPVKMFEQEVHAYLVLAHADEVLVKAGDEPKLGELIMVADNTGFSTGPHTHIGLYRIRYENKTVIWLDKNKANGSFSPELFFTREYAVDKADLPTLMKSGMRYYQYLLRKSGNDE